MSFLKLQQPRHQLIPLFPSGFFPSDILPSIFQAESLSPPESSRYIKSTDKGKAIQAEDGKKASLQTLWQRLGRGHCGPPTTRAVSITRHIQQGPWPWGMSLSRCFGKAAQQKKRVQAGPSGHLWSTTLSASTHQGHMLTASRTESHQAP